MPLVRLALNTIPASLEKSADERLHPDQSHKLVIGLLAPLYAFVTWHACPFFLILRYRWTDLSIFIVFIELHLTLFC